MNQHNFIPPPDLSALSIDELLALVDMLCSTEQIRAMALFASAYNAWQMQQAGHRRTIYPQLPMHRCLPGKQVQP